MIKYFLIVFTFFINISQAKEIIGNVSKVYDGDTCHVMEGTTKHKIRLSGIDTPEIKQTHGIQSRDALRELILNNTVTVEYSKRDRYGRIIGTIYHDKKDINLIMISTGNAWHYKYYDKQKTYADAEAKAKNNKLGLWALPNPIAPWNFRRKKK